MDENELPLMDRQILDVLRQELSAMPSAFVNIIGLFLQEVGNHLKAMHAALEANQLAVVTRIAHSMKSQCGAVGATCLQDLFIQLEQLAREDRMIEIVELLPKVNQVWEATRPLLEQLLIQSAAE